MRQTQGFPDPLRFGLHVAGFSRTIGCKCDNNLRHSATVKGQRYSWTLGWKPDGGIRQGFDR